MNKTISMLIRWLYLVIGCALLAAAGVRLVGQWKMADTVKEYLTPEAFAPAATSYNADGEYAGLPLEATDFAGFTPLFSSAQTLVFQEGIVREYSLPCDITYYSWDGSDLIPALVLDKGTDVLFFPTEAEGAPLIPAGYGVNSFPGTESGWRYAADTGKNWNGITAGNPADGWEYRYGNFPHLSCCAPTAFYTAQAFITPPTFRWPSGTKWTRC